MITLIPVSYTHLDVYKRQDALTPETVSELGGHLSKKNNSLVVTYIHRIIAVSYTHLYQRIGNVTECNASQLECG